MRLIRSTNATALKNRRFCLMLMRWDRCATYSHEVFLNDKLFHAEMTLLKRTLSLQLYTPWMLNRGHRTITCRRYYSKKA